MNSFVNASVDSALNGLYSPAYIREMNFGKNLDEAMTARSIESQKALERLAGVPQPTINRVLKGQTPDLGTAKKLADALGIGIEWLVSREGRGPNSPNRDRKPLLSDEAESLIQRIMYIDKQGNPGRETFAYIIGLLEIVERLILKDDSEVVDELAEQEKLLSHHAEPSRVRKHASRKHE